MEENEIKTNRKKRRKKDTAAVRFSCRPLYYYIEYVCVWSITSTDQRYCAESEIIAYFIYHGDSLKAFCINESKRENERESR